MTQIITKSGSAVSTACIVLPTYNEAENIRHILDKILFEKSIHQKKGIQLHVLIVDDNSPDNTAGIVRKYQLHHTQVHLLVRKEKNGLGAAYVDGIKHALRTINPDVILEMDADGQHDPRDIFRLIQAIDEGADFVIGSRYVPGGSVPSNWGLHRKIISKSANLYARTLLNSGGAKDCTGGFRAIRASLLRRISLSELDIKGFAFQVSLLNAAALQGASVVEVPIQFRERERGDSKMNPMDIVTGGLGIANIRIQQLIGSTSQSETAEVS